MRKKILIFTSVISACALFTSCGILPQEEEFQTAPLVKQYEGYTYGKTAVVKGDIVQSEEVMGEYRGTASSDSFPEPTTLIKKVNVKEGDRVEIGDVLVEYYFPAYEKSKREASNNVKSYQLKITQERELMNLEAEKAKKTGSTEKEIAAIKAQHNATIKSFETELKINQLAYKSAVEDIEGYDTCADINGKVTYIQDNLEGSTNDGDTKIITITGKTRNRFEAKTKYASKFKEGQTIDFTVKNQSYKGTIKKPEDGGNKIYIYPNGNVKFTTGDSCSLDCILSEQKDVLYLPSATIFTMDDKHIVYYEDGKGMKAMKEVQVGETINHLTIITGGLAEGDQVITN